MEAIYIGLGTLVQTGLKSCDLPTDNRKKLPETFYVHIAPAYSQPHMHDILITCIFPDRLCGV
jgi:hypothetical protein